MYTAVTIAAAVLAAAGAVAAPPQGAEPRAVEERGTFAVPLNAPRAAFPRSTNKEDIIEHLRDMSIGTREKYRAHLSPEAKRNLKRDIAIRDAQRRKRATGVGVTTMANSGVDSSYSATVNIGTPAQSLWVVMDTGSSDLWVVDSSCTACAEDGLPLFDESKSSTVRRTNVPFGVKYGSGEVSGALGTETVSMAGFTVNNQYFGLVDQAVGTQPGSSRTTALLNAPLSGIMGLGFQGITVDPQLVTPWWELLARQTWKDPEFGVFMKRYRGQTNVQQFEANGGEIVFGGVNTSMFQGKMNYISLAANSNDYWRIPVDDISLGGKSLGYNDNSFNAAIDTGTTLIGAPSAVVRAIYSNIPGSQELSSVGMDGYYAYPCSTTIDFSMTFGGVNYPISNDDFNFSPLDDAGRYCIGAVFTLDSSPRAIIQWIVGATFLKNVYSVYRYNPTAVGFATLANGVQSVGNDLTQGGDINPLGNGGNGGHIPSGVTIGGNPQNTGSSRPLGGASSLRAPTAVVILASLLAAFL